MRFRGSCWHFWFFANSCSLRQIKAILKLRLLILISAYAFYVGLLSLLFTLEINHNLKVGEYSICIVFEFWIIWRKCFISNIFKNRFMLWYIVIDLDKRCIRWHINFHLTFIIIALSMILIFDVWLNFSFWFAYL